MNIIKICVLISLVALTAKVSRSHGQGAGSSQAVLVMSIAGADLPGKFYGVIPEGVDISPDDSKVAVVFEVGESNSSIGVWVGIWDLSSKKLLKSARIQGPLSSEDATNPQHVRAVRFSPRGGVLVVQTGPRICVVDAETLAPMFSLGPTRIAPSAHYGEALRSFDISADGERLAVLTAGIYNPAEDARVGIQIFDLKSGRRLAEWQVAGRSQHVSLSPDGSLLVLDGTGKARGFSLIDSLSGRILRSFDSGWPMGSGTAILVDSGRIATIPEIGTDDDGKSFGDSLKLFNADTGSLINEIRCPKFGSTATLAAARRQPFLATVNAYQTPKEVRSDTAIRKSKPELVIFRLSDGTCHSILKPVPHGQFKSTLDQYSLRLSSDASLITLFEDAVVKVYRVPQDITAMK